MADDRTSFKAGVRKRGAPIKGEYAKRLRRNLTRGELLLWDQLASAQLGVKFRRQHPLYGYIVDFYCIEFRLAVEVDGSSHDGREGYDRMRDRHLADRGIKTLRIADALVRDDPQAAARLVGKALEGQGMPASRLPVDGKAAARRRAVKAIQARRRREKEALEATSSPPAMSRG